MLRVTIEYLPDGDESRREEIARASIYDDRTGTYEAENYSYEMTGVGRFKAIHHGRISGHYPSDGPWKLMYLILQQAVGRTMLPPATSRRAGK